MVAGEAGPAQAVHRRVNERINRPHINPNIGHMPVQKLRPEDLDTLYARLLTEGKRNGEGGGLSAQSVRNVHITIQGAL